MIDAATTKAIADQLVGPYCQVHLLADGHKVHAIVQRIAKKSIRYGVVVYVDGYMKGEYLRLDSPVGAKFYPLRTRQLFPAKKYAAYRKDFGKRAEADFRKRTLYQYRDPFFSTGSAFARHLRKHAESVQFVEGEGVAP